MEKHMEVLDVMGLNIDQTWFFNFMSCTLTGCYVDDGVGLGGGSCST